MIALLIISIVLSALALLVMIARVALPLSHWQTPPDKKD